MNKKQVAAKIEITRDAWMSCDDLTKEIFSIDISLRTKNYAYFADIHFDDEQDLVILADAINDYIAKHIKS